MICRNLITYRRQLILQQHERFIILAQKQNWTEMFGSHSTPLLESECHYTLLLTLLANLFYLYKTSLFTLPNNVLYLKTATRKWNNTTSSPSRSCKKKLRKMVQSVDTIASCFILLLQSSIKSGMNITQTFHISQN